MENNFPDIGAINEEVLRDMVYEKKVKGTVIIIWTCRSGEYMKEMWDFLDKNDIPYDYINRNYPHLGFETGRKIYADEYWDDRAKEIY